MASATATPSANLAALITAAALTHIDGYEGCPVWNRPEDGQYPVPNADAQVEFGRKLHALIQEGINAGVAGAFLTPSENGRTSLVACTIPMEPLVVEVGENEQVITNRWALNLNVAIPKERKEKSSEEPAKTPTRAMTFSELREFTRKNRETKK